MKIEESGLRPDTQNANEGTQRGLGLLDKSLRKLGAGRSILVDKNGNVISGNKTLERAADIDLPVQIVETDGKSLVVVKRTDLDLYSDTDTRARQLAYADNKVAELDLAWKPEQIAIDFEPLDLGEWGFDAEPETKDAEPQIDRAAELNEKWRVKTGDLWQIGEHRLLCGSCIENADIERLMNTEAASLVVTSPPYYNQRPEYAIFESYEKYNEFLSSVITGIMSVADNPFILAWNTGDNQPDCLPMIADQTVLIHSKGFTYLDTIIWKKKGAVYSIPRSAHIRTHNYYYPALAWEPIIIFRVGDKMPKFDDKNVNQVSEYGINVWEIDQVNGNTQDNVGHPAIFPEELASRVIMAYSMTNNVVYEPFCGSGTTMVACENLHRKCRAIEISPNYCAVILERMNTAFPDLKIERIVNTTDNN